MARALIAIIHSDLTVCAGKARRAGARIGSVFMVLTPAIILTRFMLDAISKV